MDFSRDLMRGSVIPIVLALLDEQAMYGYEIVKIVNARTNGRFEWKEGTLYPTLHRLEADGLIRSQWQDKSQSTEPSGGAQRRKYYATTRRGRAELTRRRTEWRQFSESMDAVLMGA